MCGIVGYIGDADAVEVILSGLHRLEYRGYDSAGIAVIQDGALELVKSHGKLAVLDRKLEGRGLTGHLGIGHTRWATHGAPNETNAHPHLDGPKAIALVHNGIIENHHKIRQTLQAEGVEFRSGTDTEVLVHLIRKHYEGDLFAAVKRALQQVQGAYALGVICRDNPGVMVAARQGSPLVVGVGEDASFIASDIPAIMKYTRRVLYLEDGQVCEIRRDGCRIEDLQGNSQHIDVKTVDWADEAAEKDGYAHFMLKEIHQQAGVIRRTLLERISGDSNAVHFDELDLDDEELGAFKRVMIVSCGTAWHASLIGKLLLENIAGIPVEVDVASEYRYRDPIVEPGTLVMSVTQSGETADTLEAIRIAKGKGGKVVSIINVVGSSIARESAGVIYTQAGPEIGVASTKAYTSQVTALALFALHLATVRGVLSEEDRARLIGKLREIPDAVQWCLDHQEAVQRCAGDPKYRDARSALFLGRNYNYPSALEGALKLKEISYIHAEGCTAGEMKHGPIALLTGTLPSICVATRGHVYEKMLSNIQEVRARNGLVLAIATEGDEIIPKLCDDVIYVPDCHEAFSPIVVAVPLQLFAYHIAVNRGCDVDQPRNLAKSVTVE